MILRPLKYQPYLSNVRSIPPQSSWHAHLKHFKPYTFILQKLKKPPDGFRYCLFFALEIIMIFGGLFLHRISRLIKGNLKLIRLSKTDFAIQKFITRRENQNSIKPSCKEIKKLPKDHT